MNTLAIDIGGTKFAMAVFAGDTIARREFRATDRQGGRDWMRRQVIEIARAWQKELPLDRCGIGFGGPVHFRTQVVSLSTHVGGWSNFPFSRFIQDELGIPAIMDNDANAAALGAWAFDARRQPKNLVYIQISTGVGGGLILNRQLFRGSALAGEFGHLTIQPNGPECTCGKRGCVESVCAGWALARDGRAALPQAARNSPLAHMARLQPETLDARMVLQAAGNGDALAKGIAERAFTALGTAIANVICLLDPDMIILGGGILRAQEVVRAILEPALERELPPLFKGRCELRYSTLEGLETLLGAALLEADAINA
jgi:glucokinase